MTIEAIKKAQAEIQRLEKKQDEIFEDLLADLYDKCLTEYQRNLLFDFCFNGFPEEDDEIIEKVL